MGEPRFGGGQPSRGPTPLTCRTLSTQRHLAGRQPTLPRPTECNVRDTTLPTPPAAPRLAPLTCCAQPMHPTRLRQVFLDSSLPVIEHYEQEGKVARINADRDPDEIYQEVRRLFLEF